MIVSVSVYMKKVCFECIRNAKMFCGFFAVNTFECTAKKQRTVIYCNKLQHTVTTASYCNTLQHTATLQWKTSLRADEYFTRDTLQHTVRHFNTLQHIVTHCNTLQHNATLQ